MKNNSGKKNYSLTEVQTMKEKQIRYPATKMSGAKFFPLTWDIGVTYKIIKNYKK